MKTKTPNELSLSICHQLNSYAIAAGAAGVGVLALTQPANAKIAYTPAHTRILVNHTVSLDLNHDGNTDFRLRNHQSTTSVGSFKSDRLSVLPVGANQIWGHRTQGGADYASALKAGVRVNASGAFSNGPRSMAYGRDDVGSYYCEGKWNGVSNRFLGLKFTIRGKVHFGWARFNVSCNKFEIDAVLTGYAFETVANKGIVTGHTKGPDVIADEPASLGHLAQGASRTQVRLH